jgi:hypothetical protein
MALCGTISPSSSSFDCSPGAPEALEILRGLIERVMVVPAETGFAIELTGEIANMVRLSAGAESLAKEPYRSSVKVVAGARIHRDRHSLTVPI